MPTRDVRNASELIAAAKSAGEILLAPGNYGRPNIGAAKDVVLRSADKANPAKLEGLISYGPRALLLQHLLIADFSPPNVQTQAIDIRDSDTVTLDALHFRDLPIGVKFDRFRNVKISRLSAERTKVDVFNFNDGDGVTLDTIYATDWRPPRGAHPDLAQFYTTPQSGYPMRPVKNIVLRRVCGYAGLDAIQPRTHDDYNGQRAAAQGVFANAASNVPFENLTIEQCLLIGMSYHAITVQQAKGRVRIVDNEVLGVDVTSWIQLVGVTGDLELERNIASQFNIQGALPGSNRDVGLISEADGKVRANAWLKLMTGRLGTSATVAVDAPLPGAGSVPEPGPTLPPPTPAPPTQPPSPPTPTPPSSTPGATRLEIETYIKAKTDPDSQGRRVIEDFDGFVGGLVTLVN
jgi:hypothetical protein